MPPDLQRQQTPSARRAAANGRDPAFATTLARGFCTAKGDYRGELHGLAAPLMHTRSGRILSVNCGISAFRLRPGQLEEEIGPRLVALAATIRALAANT